MRCNVRADVWMGSEDLVLIVLNTVTCRPGAAAGLAGGTTQVQCLELQHNTSEADTALRSIPPRHPFL